MAIIGANKENVLNLKIEITNSIENKLKHNLSFVVPIHETDWLLFFFFLIDVVTIFHHFLLKGSTVHYNFSHREQERTPFIKNNRSQGLTLTPKIFVTRGSHVITQYICLTDPA